MQTDDLPDNLVDVFEYLDTLRRSGATNMFGAGAYLEAQYGFSRTVARRALTAWMDTFDPDASPAERALKASTA